MKEIAQISIQTRKLRYHKLDGRVREAKKKLTLCGKCNMSVDNFLKDAGLVVLSKEKGIDVLIATDMIRDAFQNRWDVALLFTGDADFVPAVNLVQTLKKQVINVHLYEGSSSELRTECNSHILIDIDKKGTMHLR